ncbi:hypothetical protein [Loktanella sp. S4079]|uniref:hypothetical protein n=1 Tax=Loktanella sp. S4079 TaxID=579483 RepID=UPI000698BB99|nr:hypothetical protein [Loktanella sp. S4079]
MNEILVPLAAADLIDRIVTLQLRIETSAIHAQDDPIMRQKNLLERLAHRVLPDDPEIRRIRRDLYEARCDLHAIEEDLRACDERADFGVAFIALTRALLASTDALEEVMTELRDHLTKPLLMNEEYAGLHGLRDI